MKKSLLALAVLGAFAGAASAQSSVTLFGIVDLNLPVHRQRRWHAVHDGQGRYQQQPSRHSCVEDLGGGLTASFWIEGALNPDTGTNLARLLAASFDREPGRRLGEIRLGRDYTSTWNSTIFDPFGTNGVGSAGNLAFVIPRRRRAVRQHASPCEQHDWLLPAVGHRQWSVRPGAVGGWREHRW